ncbi:hypothetical protein TNCV_162271 [Trichonephila clavipes]|nr:hypothetical protein TNCV_162271 [Trichonephila clavipes]
MSKRHKQEKVQNAVCQLTKNNNTTLNSAQWCKNPRRARPTVRISVYVLRHEVHETTSRSDDHSEVKPLMFSPQARLVLIYRPIKGMKG